MWPRLPLTTKSLPSPLIPTTKLSSMGEDRVLHAVDDEKLATRPVQHARGEKAELVRAGHMGRHGIGVAIAELVGQRVGEGERVVHLILCADPFGVEHMLVGRF